MKFAPKYNIEDYIGKTFNYLTAMNATCEKAKDGSPQWEFRCVCGNLVVSTPSRVITGHKKSCGCMRYSSPEQKSKKPSIRPPSKIHPEEYIGKVSEKLTVVGYIRPEGKGRLQLECLCECGNTTYVLPYQFDKGVIKSCGCARFGHGKSHVGNTSRRTHGLTHNRFYKRWNDMVRRCYNQNEPAYRFYGALGITVCEEWRYSPESFIAWCESTYPNEQKLSLDRIDGSKGYSPDNCRWVTQIDQVHNLKNNRFITIGEETRCITEWCNLYGISAGAVYKRVHKGQSFEEAISELIARTNSPVI